MVTGGKGANIIRQATQHQRLITQSPPRPVAPNMDPEQMLRGYMANMAPDMQAMVRQNLEKGATPAQVIQWLCVGLVTACIVRLT